ncbi:MAG: DUF3667 domain-containing protein [Imperialibacter sp.]
MRRRRKQNACLNCGYPLNSEIYNYCPSCGQENTNTNISFGQLLYDFFNNAFSFDSRFTNSLIPFFFKPGWLTLRFNEGKRASYANPVRLYLVISLFYFFVLNMVGKKITRDIETKMAQQEAANPDLNFSFGPNLLTGTDSLHVMDSLKAELVQLNQEELDSNTKAAIESLGIKKSLDPIKVDTDGEKEGSFFGISAENWNTYNRLKDDRKLTDEMLYDSLDLTANTTTEQFLARQIIRVNRGDKQTLVELVTKNLPILMFIMLPIFALILKLLYIRRNILYVHHIMHAIHLHSFAYIIYGLSLIIIMLSDGESSLGDWAGGLGFTFVTTYAYYSLKRVYGQGWFKTITKFILLGWIYSWMLFIGIMAELLISFLLF